MSAPRSSSSWSGPSASSYLRKWIPSATGPSKPTADYSLEEWNGVLALNLTGVFLGLKH